MQISRRNFLQQTVLSASALATSFLLPDIKNSTSEEQRIVILHTGDMHSHLEAFPMDGSANQGLGGIAARAEMVEEIRSKNKHVLLLDAGDIFGNTPYFELFKGEPEIKAMSAMKYDAVTIGESDFAAGVDNYANIINRFADLPVVVCNYNFTNTSLQHKIPFYKVFQKGNVKIGVTGVGIELQGLIADELYGNVKYLNPIENANRIAGILKKKEGCDLIICLSHLGDKYNNDKVSDNVLARESYDIDLIISAHTHRFFDEPRKYINKIGKEVVVNQVGWAGIELGRLDYNLLKSGKKNLISNSIIIGKKYED